MKPTRPINVNGNPNWQYRNASKTNLVATFARVRKEQREAKEAEEAALANVAQIKRSQP